MTNEEAIKFGKLIIEIAEQCDDKESEHTIEFTKLAVESIEILAFAQKELQFAIEHTNGEEQEHYQRALNLLKSERK